MAAIASTCITDCCSNHTHTHTHTHTYTYTHTHTDTLPANLLFKFPLLFLLLLVHSDGIVGCINQQHQVQLLWVSHHLAQHLIVGEHGRPAHGLVVAGTLPSQRQLGCTQQEDVGDWVTWRGTNCKRTR